MLTSVFFRFLVSELVYDVDYCRRCSLWFADSETGMNLTWVAYTPQCRTAHFLIPIFLSVTWVETTAHGVVAGKKMR